MTVRHRSIRDHSRPTAISEPLFLPLYRPLLLDSYSADPIQFNCSQIDPTLPCGSGVLKSIITTCLGYYWQRNSTLPKYYRNVDIEYDEPSDIIMSSIFTNSTSLANTSTLGSHYDFISFLAVAQRLGMGFLPITWQQALDLLGMGGTAEIRQSLINLQRSLVFKRNTLSTMSEESRYRTLISEVSILGHPAIRNHTNVVTLEGICWDISVDDEKV